MAVNVFRIVPFGCDFFVSASGEWECGVLLIILGVSVVFFSLLFACVTVFGKQRSTRHCYL
jgi:hypothetical protein